MHSSTRTSWALALMVLALFSLSNASQAGIFDAVRGYVRERRLTSYHSRNVISGVRALHREQHSIQRFAQSASELVRAYHAIRDERPGVLQLLNIAAAINGLVSEYSNLAPKASAVYREIKPSLDYFATLKDDSDDFTDASGRFVIKSFSDRRINSMARSAGWSRVWDTIKENQINVFRWGRLRDEYNLARLETKYILKCVQIAFEGLSYYEAARASISELLNIRSAIDKILGAVIFGAGNAGRTVQDARRSSMGLSQMLAGAVNHMGKRFDELLVVQNEYVEAHRNYVWRYQRSNIADNQFGAPPRSTVPTPRHRGDSTVGGTARPPRGLDQAMAEYQRAYEAYIRLAQQGSQGNPRALQQALDNLAATRRAVDAARAGSRPR